MSKTASAMKSVIPATVVLAVVGLAAAFWWRQDQRTVLPNGLVLRNDDLLTTDERKVLATDIEFVCFDDRFTIAGSRTLGQSGLFDAVVDEKVLVQDHPEIFQPDGLKYGKNTCNGYYTWMIGPRLLVSGNRPPFLPPCESVNRENMALKDKAWLNHPCLDD